MSLGASKARLAAATKELSMQWQRTKEQWKDARSAEFEHKYLDELLASTDSAMEVIDQLDKLIARIKSDCG